MKGIFFQRIDGKTSVGNRCLALKSFRKDRNCTVILASIGAVAEGCVVSSQICLTTIEANETENSSVDLTSATHIHLVEPHWNPMIEAQAVDRVHRIGQCCNVTITRYIVKDSIEKVRQLYSIYTTMIVLGAFLLIFFLSSTFKRFNKPS